MVEDQLESLLGMVKRGLSADFDLMENGTERASCVNFLLAHIHLIFYQRSFK